MLKSYFYLGNSVAACTRENNLRYVVDTRDVGTVNFLLQDIYERDVEWAFNHLLTTGDSFIDVGANCGIHTVMAGLKVGASGRGWALEPNPHIFGLMKKNLALNGVRNVEPMQAAAFHQAGEVEFSWRQDEHRVGAVVLNDVAESVNYGETKAKVRALRIDDLDVDPSKLRLIKIDVEGREPFVIEGARETIAASKCALICEYHEHVIESVYGSASRYHALIDELALQPFAIDWPKNELRPLTEWPKTHANLVLKPR